MKICSYAICGDEPIETVKRWLKCVEPSDYVVVLCTKPNSEAANYLTSLRLQNVFIYSHEFIPWRFDDARNESLRLAELTNSDLYFCSDIDECVIPDFYADCKAAFEKHPKVRNIWYKFASKVGKDLEVQQWFWNNKVHQKGWKWQYPVHETLTCLSDEYSEDVYLDSNKIYLYHLPDDRPRTSYLPLLELRAEENKDDVYSLFYLMREYSFYNECSKVVEVGTHLLHVLLKTNDKSMKSITCLFLGKYSFQLGLRNISYGYFTDGIKFNPKIKDNYILLAQYLTYEGRTKEARDVLSEISIRDDFVTGDWRLYQYLYEPWKVYQIVADINCWEGKIEEAKEYIDNASKLITEHHRELDAYRENFYIDKEFIDKKYEELKD